jgi:hypothetical protein
VKNVATADALFRRPLGRYEKEAMSAGNDWHRIPLKRRKRKANDQHNNNVAGFIPGDIGPGVFGKDTKR